MNCWPRSGAMSESTGQAELFAVASGFLMRLNEIEPAAPFLAAYDMRCEFDVLDGEPFHAAIAGGRVAAVERGRVAGLQQPRRLRAVR